MLALALALVAAAGPAAAAPQPAPPLIRLSDLLAEARRNNPALRAARARAAGARAAVEPAGALDDPMLMLQLWNVPVDFSSAPVMASLTQPIPLGGKLRDRKAAAAAAADSSAAMAEAQANEIEAELEKAYFDLFLADRTVHVDGEIGGTLRALVGASASRVAAGLGQESEALRAQAELLKVESDSEEAAARRKAAVARLVALLDRPPGSDLGTPRAPGLLPSLPPQEELRSRALRERPEVAAARAAVAEAEAGVRLAAAQRVPDLGVSAGEMHMFGAMKNAPTDFLFLGVQGNLPVFGARNDARIEEARARAESAREEERALENAIDAEIAGATAEIEAEAREIALHHQLIPISRQALASALAAYSAGRDGFPMVLDAERDLQMHELDLAMHLSAYSKHLADLQRAVGADLGLARAADSGMPMPGME